MTSGKDMLTSDEQLGFTDMNHGTQVVGADFERKMGALPYATGQYVGQIHHRSPKLNLDPVMELKRIIGYTPKPQSIKWSQIRGENSIIFSQGATLVVMDVETNQQSKHQIQQQKRFFFGHSEPICCFDVAGHGNLVASAQDGQISVIRIWDYHTARCIT